MTGIIIALEATLPRKERKVRMGFMREGRQVTLSTPDDNVAIRMEDALSAIRMAEAFLHQHYGYARQSR